MGRHTTGSERDHLSPQQHSNRRHHSSHRHHRFTSRRHRLIHRHLQHSPRRRRHTHPLPQYTIPLSRPGLLCHRHQHPASNPFHYYAPPGSAPHRSYTIANPTTGELLVQRLHQVTICLYCIRAARSPRPECLLAYTSASPRDQQIPMPPSLGRRLFPRCQGLLQQVFTPCQWSDHEHQSCHTPPAEVLRPSSSNIRCHGVLQKVVMTRTKLHFGGLSKERVSDIDLLFYSTLSSE